MSTTEPLLPAAAAGAGGGSGATTTAANKKKKGQRVGIDDALSMHAGEFGRWQLRHFVLVSAAWALEALHTMVIIFADREPAMVCAAPGGCGDRCAGGGRVGVGRGRRVVHRRRVGARLRRALQGRARPGRLLRRLHDRRRRVRAPLRLVPGPEGLAASGLRPQRGLRPAHGAVPQLLGLRGAAPPHGLQHRQRRRAGLRPRHRAHRAHPPRRRGHVHLLLLLRRHRRARRRRRAHPALLARALRRHLAPLARLRRRRRALRLRVPALVPRAPPRRRRHARRPRHRRRGDDAMRVVRDIAAANGRVVPDDVALKLDDEDEDGIKGVGVDDSTAAAAASSSGSIVDVFRSRTTRVRLVLSVLINLLTSVVYYGLSLNVVNLKTNLYVTVVVNSLAEMPAYLLTALLLDRFGRKPLAIGTMLLSGSFCTAGSLIAGEGIMRVVRMACGVVGIFGMAATYNLLFIYTAELFPTVVRNAALGCTAQAAQMGAIVAPLVVVLGERVPFAVFGASGIVGGLLVFYLPETMNKPLYDTMAGLEEGEKSLLK